MFESIFCFNCFLKVIKLLMSLNLQSKSFHNFVARNLKVLCPEFVLKIGTSKSFMLRVSRSWILERVENFVLRYSGAIIWTLLISLYNVNGLLQEAIPVLVNEEWYDHTSVHLLLFLLQSFGPIAIFYVWVRCIGPYRRAVK
jgi:hypothetical protein